MPCSMDPEQSCRNTTLGLAPVRVMVVNRLLVVPSRRARNNPANDPGQ